MSLIIGLTGHAGVGKSTAAAMLEDFIPECQQFAFANPLKEAAADLFGIGLEHFHLASLKNFPLDYWAEWTPRKILQLLGTEGIRSIFGEDFWTRRMELEFLNCFDSEAETYAIIHDVRFQNELEWIRSKEGIIIHLTRNGYDGNIGIQSHASEATLDYSTLTLGKDYYEVENNSTTQYLSTALYNVVVSIFNQKEI